MAINLTSYKDLQLVEGTAKKTYNKEGFSVKKGLLSLRVHFSIFGISNRFDFSCQKVSSENLNETVPFEIDGERIYLLVSDCSNRLHISKEKILEYSKNGILKKLFEKKLNKFALLSKIINNFTAITKNYKEDLDKKLLVSKHNQTIKIQKNTLMKIVHLFCAQSKNQKIPFFIFFPEKTRKKYETTISQFLAFNPPKKLFFLIDLNSKQNSIAGAFSQVSCVNCISHGCFFAMKESLNKETSLDIKNEVANLRFLKKSNLTDNILLPYFFKKDLSKITVFSPYCNKRDLTELLLDVENKEDRVRLFAKPFTHLIAIIKKWHDKLITHGDIKPENILVHQEKDNSYKFYLGDLGGVHHAKKGEKFIVPPYTPCYSPPYDRYKELFVEEHMARDVFQLGMTIATIFTAMTPYQEGCDSNAAPNFHIPFYKGVLLEICSLELTCLLENMCSQFASKRPNMELIFSIVSEPSFKWGKTIFK